MKLKFPSPRTRILLAATVGLTVIGGVAVSQTAPLPAIQWDVRRLDTLDRNVRRLERALTQRNAAGQPVLVESDPEVVALQGQVGDMSRRLQDLEQSLQTVNASLERTSFALDERTRDAATLRTRLTETDNRLKAVEDAARTAAVAPPPAEETGPASPTGSAAGDLAAARGAEAFEAVMANWPNTAQSREASWRLGDIQRAADDHAGAVQSYAGALSGWPTTPWAGEVTLKLARALNATNRAPQACGAVGEFNRRYAGAASAQLKAVATQISGQANCA